MSKQWLEPSANSIFIPSEWISYAPSLKIEAWATLGFMVKEFWDLKDGKVQGLKPGVQHSILWATPETIVRCSAMARKCPSVLKKYINALVVEQVVDRLMPDPVATKEFLLANKYPQHFGLGNALNCEWCGAKTLVLHKHHYPIRRSQGGVDTASICPNCHAEFHILDACDRFRLSEQFAEFNQASSIILEVEA